MKTLADLKKDMKIGDKWNLISRFGKPPADKISGQREICHIQSNSFAFKKGNGKSWCEFPPASLLEYDSKTVKIYDPGYRPLTEAEQKIVDNMPSYRPENREAAERDMLSDGSSTYWMDKRYTAKNKADWYWEKTRGLYYNRNDKNMRDNTIKGKLSLHYEIIGGK